MKSDLQAGIEQFATHTFALPTDMMAQVGSETLSLLADERSTVRLRALLNLFNTQSVNPASPATLESLALDDPDRCVRGLAILLLVRSPSDIENPILRDFAEERGDVADEIIEVLRIIRGANHDLQESRASLGRIAELTDLLTAKKEHSSATLRDWQA